VASFNTVSHSAYRQEGSRSITQLNLHRNRH